MTFTPVNILNLLTAAGGPTGNGSSPNSAGSAVNAGVVFGDIISGLLLGGADGLAGKAQLPFATQSDIISEAPNFEQGFINQTLAQTDDSQQIIPTLVTGLLGDQTVAISNINSGSICTPVDDSGSIVLPELPQVQVSKPQASQVSAGGFVPDVMSLLPHQAVVMNQNLRDVVTSVPIDLPLGRYDVVSSQVTDGSLQLQIVSDADPTRQIKLSISLDALQGIGAEKSAVTGSEKLDLGVTNTQSTFAKLVAKLNTQSIEISRSMNSNAAQSSTSTGLTVSLFDGTTSSEILLRTQLRPVDLRATVSNTRNDQQSKSTDLTLMSDESTEAVVKPMVSRTIENDGTSNAQSKVGRAAVADQESPFVTPFDQTGASEHKKDAADTFRGKVDVSLDQVKRLLEKDSTDGKSASRLTNDKTDTIFGLHKTTIDSTDIPGKKDAPQVKFVLPEDVKTALKPAGREITLRIEPEHLGPAKLSLSINNDELSARLVVNTTSAKNTLEGSLDKLLTQLAKADIKVQQIQVMVSGEAPQHHLFERRPEWSRNGRFRNGQPEGENAIEENIMQVTHSPAARGGYVGQGRVNLLA